MHAISDPYLNGSGGWDVVGKVTGIEIALQSTNGEDEFGTLYLLLDFRTTDTSDVNLESTTDGISSGNHGVFRSSDLHHRIVHKTLR